MKEYGDGTEAGSYIDTHWITKGTFWDDHHVLVVKTFNTFKQEYVPLRNEWDQRTVETGERRHGRDGDMCWIDCEYAAYAIEKEFFNLLQYTELWSINVTLQGYYDFVAGWGYGGTASGLGLGASAAPPIASVLNAAAVEAAAEAGVAGISGSAGGAAVATAGGAAAVIAAGMSAFYLTTWAMTEIIESQELISAGWTVIGNGYTTGDELAPTMHWVRCTPIRPCRPTTGDSEHGVGNDNGPGEESPEGDGNNSVGEVPGGGTSEEPSFSPHFVPGTVVHGTQSGLPLWGITAGEGWPRISAQTKKLVDARDIADYGKYVITKPKEGGSLRLEQVRKAPRGKG